MEALTTTLHVLHQQLAFMNIRDGIEILFFAVAFFYAAEWFKQDRTQPLLGYFYGYLALTLASYFTGLFAISFVLCALSSAVAMVFILIHQNTLQKNYVALRNLTPRKQAHQSNWVELLVRSCLVAMNNKKPVMCVIEQRDSLSQFIWAPFTLNSYIQPGLIELLLQNPAYDPNTFLRINQEGKLLAIQCSWEQFGQEQFTSVWHEDALLFTAKTDAVVMYADPNTHTFSLIAHDKLIEGLSAPQAVRLMSSYVVQPRQSSKGEIQYHEKSKTTGSNQPTH